MHAVDDFKVTSVNVSILNKSGEIIETGNAVSDKHGVVWVYTVNVANSNTKGCKIVATASDVPGNEDVMESSL